MATPRTPRKGCKLHRGILNRSVVFGEYTPQARIEGEIQQVADNFPVTKIWEILSGTKPGRTYARQITLFDGVGFAIEDFSALRYVRDPLDGTGRYQQLDMLADPDDPRDLFGMVRRHAHQLGPDHGIGGQDRDLMPIFGQLLGRADPFPATAFVQNGNPLTQTRGSAHDVFDRYGSSRAGHFGHMRKGLLKPGFRGNRACRDNNIGLFAGNVIRIQIAIVSNLAPKMAQLACVPVDQVGDLSTAWLLEVVLVFRPVCSLVKMDQGLISGC